MDFDLTQWILFLIGIFLLLPVGFFLGRFLDLAWRAAQLKRFTKKDYFLFNIRQKDKKTFIQELVCAEQKAVIFNNNYWVLLKDRVYIEKTPNMGFSLKSPSTPIFYKWGIPTVYVDGDSMEPLSFNDILVPPSAEEMGAAQNAWDLNQRNKNLSAAQMLQTLLILCLLASAAAFGIGFMNMNALNDMKTKIDAIDSGIGNVIIQPIKQNDTIVVNQPKK